MVQKIISIPRETTALQINSDVKGHFKGIARWAILFSSLSFVIIIVVLTGAIVNGFNMSAIRGGYGWSPLITSTGYLFVGLLLAYPCWTLFRFGILLKKAAKEEDQTTMNNAFTNLKTGLMYGGLGIVGLVAMWILGVWLV